MTIDEILIQMFTTGEPFYNEKDIKHAMQEYAKLKVKEALELASQSVELIDVGAYDGNGEPMSYYEINKQSITNVFEQIKFD